MNKLKDNFKKTWNECIAEFWNLNGKSNLSEWKEEIKNIHFEQTRKMSK